MTNIQKRLIIFNLALFSFGTIVAQDKMPQASVNDFLNSIGVNSAIYRRTENINRTIECINYLGVRWIRTDESWHTDEQVAHIKRLHEATGAKISTSLGSSGNNIEQLIIGSKRIAQLGALLAIEGNNEPNNWGITYQGQHGGRDGSWVAVARLQRDLYRAAKADSKLKNYPIWATTETGAMVDNVGLQYIEVPHNDKTVMEEFRGVRYADVANCHNYFIHPSWAAPQNNQTWLSANPTSAAKGDHLYGNYGLTWLKRYKGYSEEELQTIPRVTTETGATISGALTEEMQGKMYLSCYLAQFAQGWSHTSIYILRDRSDEGGNQTFGFYDKYYRPRKAAHYLHNMTTILADGNSPKRLKPLNYTIEGQSAEVHDLLLQKSDSGYVLIVWGEHYASGKSIVTVRFNKKHSLKLFNPIGGTSPICEGKMNNALLELTDHPIIIEIR